MRPERLSLEGFCSFIDPVEVDLTGVRTAAIVGPNGAGKTSLLDAMVFALYGQPRVPGDVESVVATTAENATVALTFTTSDGARWRVTRSRQRRARRSSACLETEDPTTATGWRPVTSGGVRDTDEAVVELVGASLETFTATTFAAQGDLDRFTAAAPAQRRQVLGEILRLDRFAVLEAAAKSRAARATTELEAIDRSIEPLTEQIARRPGLEAERHTVVDELAEVEQTAASAAALVEEATRLDQTAADARSQSAASAATALAIRAQLEAAAGAGRALEAAIDDLVAQHEAAGRDCDIGATARATLPDAQRQHRELNRRVEKVSDRVASLAEGGATLGSEAHAQRAGVDHRRRDIEQDQDRLAGLEASHEGVCYTCNQPLSPEQVVELTGRLRRELDEAVAAATAAQEHLARTEDAATALRADWTEQSALLQRLDSETTKASDRVAKLEAAVAAAEQAAGRIGDLDDRIRRLRAQRQALDGQDTSTAGRHDLAGREAAERAGRLTAQAQALREEASSIRRRNEQRLGGLQQRVGALDEALAGIEQAERTLTELETQRVQLVEGAERWNTLITAFGRSGVPLMILDGVVAELAVLANEALVEVTGGKLLVDLVTRRPARNGATGRDTLDIVVSSPDSGDRRRWESYSGGERRNIAAALRIGLARLLARRSGAAIRTLVLDEGWGALDVDGIAANLAYLRRLGSEFDLVLTVTHIDAVADAFPTVIRVHRDTGTSTVTVESA